MVGLVLLLVVLSLLSLLLDLQVIWWVLYKVLALMALALIIIFQPELRNALARLGSSKLFMFSKTQKHEFLDTFCDAVTQLSKKRIGALFAFERAISLKDHLETGVPLDAILSPEFALTIFHPKTALHDGGMIISKNRVAGAGCVFPVSSRELEDRSTGLRHRAAIGITEETDCVAVVVSEETGQISICMDGKLERNLKKDEFSRGWKLFLYLRIITMKKMLKKNWPAKLATLLVAIAIWFLINYILKRENPGALRPGASEVGR